MVTSCARNVMAGMASSMPSHNINIPPTSQDTIRKSVSRMDDDDDDEEEEEFFSCEDAPLSNLDSVLLGLARLLVLGLPYGLTYGLPYGLLPLLLLPDALLLFLCAAFLLAISFSFSVMGGRTVPFFSKNIFSQNKKKVQNGTM